jgi:hypothetical protein
MDSFDRDDQTTPLLAGALLESVVAFVRRYVVLSATQADATALWIAHTHAIPAAETTPYLQVTSAEKRSGKTRLLEVLELLVPRALLTVNISRAALFRVIEQEAPTLLLDEYDALFGFAANRRDEDLRALLNAGHRRGATVVRVEGQALVTRRWRVFCPKALAGLGPLPDTVADRSIQILLKRKHNGETVERFTRSVAESEAAALADQLAKWAADAIPFLQDARPDLPEELDSRAADGWEPLLAIADLAGGDWPGRARRAALELSASGLRDGSSAGVELLVAVRRAFELLQTDRLFTRDLIHALATEEESAYEHWWDSRENAPAKGAARALAGLLRPFAISSADIREGGQVAKGYRREEFTDVWSRHLPELDPEPATQAPDEQAPHIPSSTAAQNVPWLRRESTLGTT